MYTNRRRFVYTVYAFLAEPWTGPRQWRTFAPQPSEESMLGAPAMNGSKGVTRRKGSAGPSGRMVLDRGLSL